MAPNATAPVKKAVTPAQAVHAKPAASARPVTTVPVSTPAVAPSATTPAPARAATVPATAADFHGLQLPLSVVGPVDLGRVLRELETIDADLLSQNIKHQALVLPKLSKLFNDTVQLNKVDLTNADQRQVLKEALTTCKLHAPLLHISFSADPSTLFIEKLMAWIRSNISPLALITVGLQPNLGAGCLIRTTNRYFDFSLRENFKKNRELLMSKLNEPIS